MNGAKLVNLLGVVLALFLVTPAPSSAQKPARSSRIGLLCITRCAGPVVDDFLHALRELGWTEGQNLTVERREAGGKWELLPDLAADLVRLQVDVILPAAGPASLRAARDATRTIPIVMVASSADPVAAGLATSLARPGGNITGLLASPPEMGAKRLQLLREVVPRLSRLAVLWDANLGPFRVGGDTRDLAARLGVQLLPFEVRRADDLEAAFEVATRQRAEALSVVGTPLIYVHHRQVAQLALKNRLPSISNWGEFAEAGGLMSYGTTLPELFKRAAFYVDRILRGSRAGELPIEQPMRFELAVNMKTARALGLTIPPSVLVRAGKVIQ